MTMQPVTLETERLVLDELRESDAQTMYEYCQDPDFERFLTIPWPYTLANARWFITEHAPVGWAEGSDLIWAIRDREGQFLHDRLLGTRLVDARPARKPKEPSPKMS